MLPEASMTTHTATGVPPVTGRRGADVLALDIGGTKLAAAVVADDGSYRGFRVVPTRVSDGPDSVIERLLELGEESLAAAGADARPIAVGISCGGPLDAAAGLLLNPPHLPGWIDIPIAALVADRFGLPAVLENDATAAALGEAWYGAARGADTAIYLTVSTGIGGGIVLGGRPHRGAAGNGGELGHITVRPGGDPCTCGRRGCLEAYCSGTNIARRARAALAAHLAAGGTSTLPPAALLTAADVSREARLGDPVARAVWDETTQLLGQALTDLVNAFEPDVAVLGGGVTRSGDDLLVPVREIVAAGAMAPAAHAATVVLAEFGDAVGVVGAAAVALDRLALAPQLEGSAR